MRRAVLILLAAALAGCAAPRGYEVCPGPPMAVEGELTGTVVVLPPPRD